ncbi:MAG: Fumonisin B1 esterase [Phycisphaerae bacterium]|nr:Fumonisin B1 esterase [Phycisphaerae bacterium]
MPRIMPMLLGSCVALAVMSLAQMSCAEPLGRPSVAGDFSILEDGTPTAPVVDVDGGKVRGAMIEGGICVYRGVPFAAPPTGARRWKPPQPVVPWQGVRECVKFGPSCPQPDALLGTPETSQSEDCLYLNVWTPAKRDGQLPVMLWIHGGGHTTGSGSRPYYDGRHLVPLGVVVVTINYRLGPLGYFAHPLLSKESPDGVSGNYGMLDQIAALKWVQRNIAGFGGDPKCLTIFGESAGSASISRLMVCPQAAGLFQRAIAESGGARGRNRHLTRTWYGMESMESVGVEVAGRLGADKTADPLAALRAVPPQKLIEATQPVRGLFGQGIKFGPVVDGWLIPDEPETLWARGKQHDVPFMAGFNADEGTVFLQQLPIKRKRGYDFIISRTFGEHGDEALRLFPAASDKDVPDAMSRMVTVSSFAAPARFMVAAMEQKKSPGYLYEFTKVSPGAAKKGWGAFHSEEIFYVFQTGKLLSFDASDVLLSELMARTWVRFARTGNPSADDGVSWPPYRRAADRLMIFGPPRVGEAPNPLAEPCDLMDRIATERRKDPAAAGKNEGGSLRRGQDNGGRRLLDALGDGE